MGRIPKGWKKTAETENYDCYSRKNYSIFLWKETMPKRQFIVEPFRNLSNYKRRLFKREFNKIDEAKKFAWNLMKQKEIRGYFNNNE